MNCARVHEYLPALLYGDLPPEEADRLEAHLAGCPACQREYAGLGRARRLLDRVPAPEVHVDLSRLYQEAARRQERRLRRWRRAALLTCAAAAVLAVLVVVPRLEVRVQAQELVVRWGPRVVEVAPAPPPPAARIDVRPSDPTPEDFAVLSQLVQGLYAAVAQLDARDSGRRAELARLRDQLRTLQEQAARRWTATDRDVAALYAAQFLHAKKGANP